MRLGLAVLADRDDLVSLEERHGSPRRASFDPENAHEWSPLEASTTTAHSVSE